LEPAAARQAAVHERLRHSAFEDGEISVFEVPSARREGDHGLPLDRRELLRTEALV
jgi:hypothetical protein